MRRPEGIPPAAVRPRVLEISGFINALVVSDEARSHIDTSTFDHIRQ